MKTNFLHHINNVNFNYDQHCEDQMILSYINEFDLLNLCGGIPIDYRNDNLLDINYSGNYFEIILNSEEHNVERNYYFNHNYIYNSFMQVYSTGTGIGTYIFINQIIQARKLGVKKFRVSAARSDIFNGYYTWARMGYNFYNKQELQDFEGLMSTHKRKEKDLFTLMLTENGRNFWKKYGFWWEGEFDLDRNSKNIKALNLYLDQAGIGFSL